MLNLEIVYTIHCNILINKIIECWKVVSALAVQMKETKNRRKCYYPYYIKTHYKIKIIINHIKEKLGILIYDNTPQYVLVIS